MEMITSLQNAQVKKWMKLYQKKERDQAGLFLVEGDHLVEEALKKGIVQTVITDIENWNHFSNVVYASKEVMKKLSSSKSGEDIIAVCKKVDDTIHQYRRLLILDGIQDPGNLGTIIRTAVSFQFDGIFASKDTCDMYNEKVIRSSEGAIFHIPIFYTELEDCIKELKQNDVYIVGTSLQEAIPLQQLPKHEKMAIILGNEGNGVSSSLLQLTDSNVKIEMAGFESLNVAIATGILAYHLYDK